MNFVFFLVGIGIVEQCRTRADGGNTILELDRPQGEAGVHIAVGERAANSAAVPAPRRALVIFDELHCPFFRGTRHRDGPGM